MMTVDVERHQARRLMQKAFVTFASSREGRMFVDDVKKIQLKHAALLAEMFKSKFNENIVRDL